MKWLKEYRKRIRGRELEHLVPGMLAYVKSKYDPHDNTGHRVQYSLPTYTTYNQEKILDMKKFTEEAKKDLGMYDTPAMQNTYHAWEKENAAHTSFSAEVIRLVNQKYKKPSDFYRPAGIDKRTWSQIKTNYLYQPSKKTALRCCIGLQMNGEEAEELLKLAGYAFSPSDPSDLVVRFCLENGIWDIPGINYMLTAQELHGLDD